MESVFYLLFGLFRDLWELLGTPLFSAFGLVISWRVLFLGGVITLMAISVFWRGAKT